jgi:hypothetical protein
MPSMDIEPKNPKLLGWGGPDEAGRLVDGSARK